jgi:dephospho-CoA kinase
VVYDAALLVEAGRAELFRPLVVVTSTPAIQRQRIMERDGLDEAQAQARMEAQLPLSQKENLADHQIRNDGDWAQLDAQVETLWLAFL